MLPIPSGAIDVLLVPAVSAVVTTLLLTPAVRFLAIRREYLAVPNDRSSHDRPTPKTGGYAMLAGIAAGAFAAGAWRDGAVAVILSGALLLAGVALVDERRAVSHFLRLILQVAVVGLVVWGIGETEAGGPASYGHPWITATVALLWTLGLVNTYNFMDGLNGIAGIAAVVTGSALALLALGRGDVPAAVLAASVAAAAAGFLAFNLRGSIFMGDSGSTALGLVFGALVLDAGGPGFVPVAAALPLAPFVLDAGTTVIRRALRGERFFSQPHRSNYYQRLHQQGWSHAAVAALYGALTGASAMVALVFDRLSTGQRAVALAAIVLGHAVVFASIQAGWWRQVGRCAAGESPAGT